MFNTDLDTFYFFMSVFIKILNKTTEGQLINQKEISICWFTFPVSIIIWFYNKILQVLQLLLYL